MKNKVLLSSLVSVAVLGLTACGGGSSSDDTEVDSIAPVITVNSGVSTLVEGENYIDAGARASDNVDASVSVISTGTVNSDVAGTYTITYSATDAAGNAAVERTRTVVVTRQASFNRFDGTWEIACQETTEPDLNNLGITNLLKRIHIDKQDVNVRVKGYTTSDCSGTDSLSLPFSGKAWGKLTYAGTHVTTICSGEKVDISIDRAAINQGEDITDQAVLNDFSDKIGLASHNALCIDGDDKLLEGLTTVTNNGATQSSRPEDFSTEGYTRKN